MSSNNMFLTFIQSSYVIYFPENSPILIVNEQNLTFYSEGKNIIEINECKKRAILSISSEFKNLAEISSEIKQIRKTNNIIEFTYYGIVYIHAVSEAASIIWRKKNEY